MPDPTRQANPCIGYLSVLEEPGAGLIGGYLIVSPRGRPLEFHCTAPIAPSRAHQLLYGASLRACLVAEEIGPSLLRAAAHRPAVVLTEDADLASIQSPDVALVRMDRLAEARGLLLGPASDALSALESHTDLAEPFERIVAAVREAQRITTDPEPADVRAA
ncbi:hypothetical protein Pla175_16820 [Pirellulimonas nuda]|uniref:Uncharacterized protein n=1 Tax=Pirellulimonas nuda TaxID=2528009 RepID=A0A518D9Z2_9BACT|nr:hypothetical protein [Pirellulimonas nuda]QDU88307.1 hypothetical protein Pla175_16820 [Pirellulimonas nuda]